MLPGKARVVGLAVWREAGIRNERTVPLNLSNLTIPRRTAQRALQSLVAAGLVSVEHRDGRPPLVTLLGVRPSGDRWCRRTGVAWRERVGLEGVL
jgi:hypothetical protein